MNEGTYPPLDNMDDLPRTLRREREARDRERAQRDQQTNVPVQPVAAYAAPEGVGYDAMAYQGVPEPYPAIVTRFRVPFFSLMLFFIKAVLAAIPALLLLAMILYGAGIGLKTYFPWLVQTEILIRFPK